MVISLADIEGGHGLPFDFDGIAEQFPKVVRDFKSRCGYNNILPKSSMSYFWKVIKRVNKTEDDHED